MLQSGGIVSSNFGADSILQRSNNLAAGRIIFRVGGKYHHNVQQQTNRITFDLHIALLQNIEETDLDLSG